MILAELLESIRIFLETGGPVVLAIAVVAALMHLLLASRALYLALGFPLFMRQTGEIWQNRRDPGSVYSAMIRRQMLAEAKRRVNAGNALVGGLIALCPILGLLGTVSGMIAVFDVVASESSGDARAMADGIARATLPTLAGIVVAVSGLGLRALIGARVQAAQRRLERALRVGQGSHAQA